MLIIAEDSKYGWYDKETSVAVYNYTKKKLGLNTEFLIVGEPENNSKNTVEKILDEYDCVIFARIGDQERFEEPSSNTKKIMSYARNIDSLCSSFASTNYLEMIKFKDVINKIFFESSNIKISCPGTELKVKLKKDTDKNKDTSVLRFPVVALLQYLQEHFRAK